jgi:hypothetical protein
MDGKKQSSKPSTPLDNDANLNQVGDETMTSFEGLQDDDEDAFDPDNADFDSAARVRYSFTGEHPGELTVGSGEDLVVLEASDPNWSVFSIRSFESSQMSKCTDDFLLMAGGWW